MREDASVVDQALTNALRLQVSTQKHLTALQTSLRAMEATLCAELPADGLAVVEQAALRAEYTDAPPSATGSTFGQQDGACARLDGLPGATSDDGSPLIRSEASEESLAAGSTTGVHLVSDLL